MLKDFWDDVDNYRSLNLTRLRAASPRHGRQKYGGLREGFCRPETTEAGWAALRALRSEPMRAKGDERILADSDFVEAVLKEADERLQRRYRLEAEGYDLDQVTKRVVKVMNIEPDLILEKSRRPQVVAARDLLLDL